MSSSIIVTFYSISSKLNLMSSEVNLQSKLGTIIIFDLSTSSMSAQLPISASSSTFLEILFNFFSAVDKLSASLLKSTSSAVISFICFNYSRYFTNLFINLVSESIGKRVKSRFVVLICKFEAHGVPRVEYEGIRGSSPRKVLPVVWSSLGTDTIFFQTAKTFFKDISKFGVLWPYVL